jgi:hypothetical protein
MAGQQKGNLLIGIFAGKAKDGQLESYNVVVSFDDKSKGWSPISYRFVTAPLGEPYSTDAITQELLDGKTERAQRIQAQWRKKKNSAVADLYEYLILQTVPYEKNDVGGPVNVLKITASRLEWVHNRTCKQLVPPTVKPSKPLKPTSPQKVGKSASVSSPER